MDARLPDGIKEIPSYIYGEERFSDGDRVRTVADLSGAPALAVHDLDHWGLKSAADTAASVQTALGDIPVARIFRVLARAMDHYFPDPAGLECICRMTGSPLAHVRESTAEVKTWCRDLAPYYRTAMGAERRIRASNSGPVVVVLPSNADQEVLFVLTQTLMSRNAAVVRPSSEGAGALVVYEFIRALNAALDELKDRSLEPLRSAVSLANTNRRDFLDRLGQDGWNYVVFGSEETVRDMSRGLQQACFPRKVLGFGTGLSMTVFWNAEDRDAAVSAIMDSVVVNRGNECNATDLIYIHEPVYEDLIRLLEAEAEGRLSGDPLDPERLGLIHPESVDFIRGEMVKRGKRGCLRTGQAAGMACIHPSIIPLTRFDTALEYPGPVVSVRPFSTIDDLAHLVCKDLADNGLDKNLITAVYCREETDFSRTVPVLKTHIATRNRPTHEFNFDLPHQGVFLVRELVDVTYLDA